VLLREFYGGVAVVGEEAPVEKGDLHHEEFAVGGSLGPHRFVDGRGPLSLVAGFFKKTHGVFGPLKQWDRCR